MAVEELLELIKSEHQTISNEAREEKVISFNHEKNGNGVVGSDKVLGLLKRTKLVEEKTSRVEESKVHTMQPTNAPRQVVAPARPQAEQKTAAPRGWATLQTDNSVSNEANGPTLQQAYKQGKDGVDKDKFSLFSLPGFSPGAETEAAEGNGEE